MSHREPLLSYAQNREDVLLARLFRPWERKGYWIDVGASHPKHDSVTFMFYQFGWTGINIEPSINEYRLLCEQRPLDINLNLAIGNTEGSGYLYVGPDENRGSSTLVTAHLDEFRKRGQTFTEQSTEIKTLQSVIDEFVSNPVDFIKIDVEGYELQVLESFDLRRIRPRLFVIEATEPNSQKPSHHHWEHILTDAGYRCVNFDGLNRYYVAIDDNDARDALALPANVHDNFCSGPTVELLAEREKFVEIRETSERFIDDLKLFISRKDSELEALQHSHLSLRNDYHVLLSEYSKQSEFIFGTQELNAKLLSRVDELERSLDEATVELGELRATNVQVLDKLRSSLEELRAVHATKLFRIMKRPRNLYGKLRRSK